MSQVHIVMETVELSGLGGCPIAAYTHIELAQSAADKMNAVYAEQKIKTLLNGGYDIERAQKWVNAVCTGHFYIDSVELFEQTIFNE